MKILNDYKHVVKFYDSKSNNISITTAIELVGEFALNCEIEETITALYDVAARVEKNPQDMTSGSSVKYLRSQERVRLRAHFEPKVGR